MEKSIWLLFLLLMMVEEQEGRRIHRRRGTSRRSGRQAIYFDYPTRCEVKYPGLYDPENPNETWNFGSCPGVRSECTRHKYGFDSENCCSSRDSRCPKCPNERFFPEGTFPSHPHNCKKEVKIKPKHFNETNKMVTYPGFSHGKFPEGSERMQLSQ